MNLSTNSLSQMLQAGKGQSPLKKLCGSDFIPAGMKSPLPAEKQALRPMTALDNRPGTKTKPDKEAALHRQAEKWVAQTFYGTLLKQSHEGPFQSEIFNGGRGGQAFQSLFDQQIADRMARSAGSKLTDAIVKHIQGAAKHAEGARMAKTRPDASSSQIPAALPEVPALMPAVGSGNPDNPFKNVRIHVAPAFRN